MLHFLVLLLVRLAIIVWGNPKRVVSSSRTAARYLVVASCDKAWRIISSNSSCFHSPWSMGFSLSLRQRYLYIKYAFASHMPTKADQNL